MACKISEKYKIIMSLVPQTINNSNATGSYHSIANVRRGILIGSGGAAAATKTFKVELLEATDTAGTGAASVGSSTATANAKVKQATVALASVANTDTVTVTTYIGATQADTATFTKAAATDAAAGEFADAAGLDACIDAAITGATPTNASTNVTITANDGYTVTVSAENVAGTITVATTQWAAVYEFDRAALDTDAPYIAPKVSVTGNGIYGCVMVLEMEDLPTTKMVAAG